MDDKETTYPVPLHPTKFDLQKEMPCPFAATGMFATSEKASCSDAYMHVEQRPRPTCKDSCCSGAVPGSFDKGDHVYSFTPKAEEKCSYYQYRRSEVLQQLQGERMDILVSGDSMMRQLFVRLVHMMRGADRVLDYHMHTHANYAVCREADNFRLSEVNLDSEPEAYKRLDLDFLHDVIPDFFKYSPNIDPMMLCKQPHIAINYLHGPDYVLQRRHLERYVETRLERGRQLTMVLSVGYWVWFPEVPQDFLEFLDQLSARIAKIVILSIPTVHVSAHTGSQGPALLAAYRARNAFMKKWIAARPAGGNIGFVDFDGMSLSANAPPICAEENWHYQCFMTWPAPSNKEALHDPRNWFRHRHYQAPLVGLYMTEDGQCHDEMNRNLWQVIFNTCLKS